MPRVISEIIGRRELIKNLVIRQLKVRYKSSSLGFLWSLLNPLLMMFVYWIVFSKLLRFRGIENFKAYLATGLFAWNFFAGSLSDSANSIVGNVSLVKRVYFPRFILPLSAVLTNLVNFLFSLVVLFLLFAFWGVDIKLCILALPLVIVIELILALGFSFFLSGLNVLFRDVEHILQVVLLAWFFLTPIVYERGLIPARFQHLYLCNPMTSIIVCYQSILYYGRLPSVWLFVMPFVFSVIVLLTGFLFFRRHEGLIVDQL